MPIFSTGGSAGSTLPAQTGNSGKFLTTDGSVTSWALPVPSQSGNSGKYLTTNGTSTSWASVQTVTESAVYLYGISGVGSSTNNKIAYWSTTSRNVGSDLSLSSSSVNGDAITVNTAGVYAITVAVAYGTGTNRLGISKNQTDLTQFISAVPQSQFVAISTASNSTNQSALTTVQWFNANDVIRTVLATGTTYDSSSLSFFYMTRVV